LFTDHPMLATSSIAAARPFSAPTYVVSTLKLSDGKEMVHLCDRIGKKPVVFMLGNFTCGPFHSMYPRVEHVAQRSKDDAVFFGVYVREAHTNDAGVQIPQPRDYGERQEVAERCGKHLKMSWATAPATPTATGRPALTFSSSHG
jgi:hypothetical protein